MFDNIDGVILIWYGFLALMGLGVFMNAAKKIGIFAFILPAISGVSYGVAWIANHFQWSIYSAVDEFAYFYTWGVAVLFGLLLVDKLYDRDKAKKILDDIGKAERRNYEQWVAHQHAQKTSASQCRAINGK